MTQKISLVNMRYKLRPVSNEYVPMQAMFTKKLF